MANLAVQFLSLSEKNNLSVDIDILKYPVGKYETPAEITEEIFNQWIETIQNLPERVKKMVNNLSYDELELQYRPGGWNIKQVVHHLADSHMNSFIRFKLILTEDTPTIKPYDEAAWAKTADADNEDIMESIDILEGLHKRWVTLLNSLKSEQKKRTFFHPEYNREFTLEWMAGLYDWHCKHHVAHIKQAIDLEGEFTPEKVDSNT
ncbi:YfiT family bacillithiol transferase [Ekhidna sp.]|uniref:YfiT family bacillithiol transferase n=1 Tax=Ekhidna sp. TaxID=2608089 RepID=UPI003B511BE5